MLKLICLLGAEVCPDDPYATMEIHISADIAIAAAQYLAATNDTLWYSQGGGRQLIEDIAEYWFVFR